MTDLPPCPRGHREGAIRANGVLVVNGEERARLRCDLPDGTFHRFAAVLATAPRHAGPRHAAPEPPAPSRPPVPADLAGIRPARRVVATALAEAAAEDATTELPPLDHLTAEVAGVVDEPPGPSAGKRNRWFLCAGATSGLLVLAGLVRSALDNPIAWLFLGLVVVGVLTCTVIRAVVPLRDPESRGGPADRTRSRSAPPAPPCPPSGPVPGCAPPRS